MSPPEDAYGTRKRLEFVREVVEQAGAGTVLDVGCGTGLALTLPLAQALPAVRFTGVDSDAESIRFADARGRPNVRFLLPHQLEAQARFDVVIASEVLEHVEEPGAFLVELRERLAPGGSLVVTLPNGYGPFELAAAFEALLELAGLLPLLRAAKRRLGRPRTAQSPVTLAASPHINFLSWRAVRRLFREAGLRVERFRARTLLCGFVLDRMMRGERLIGWNAQVADVLPAHLVSDWMFVLRPEGKPYAAPFRRGALARARRRLSERRARRR